LIDDQFGRILEALEETGQAEGTLVVFMSDHGEMLGDHGIYFKGPHFYDCAVRVPLVIRWPAGDVRQNIRAEGLVELLDLAPTFLDAAGLPIPDRMQGSSLLPVLRGESDSSSIRPHVYSEYYNAWTHKNAYGTMFRTETEKIIVYHGTEQGELYDLSADPDEFHNLWGDPSEKDRKLRLMKACFDASVLAMDPEPPRRGPF
jgi:arylsulfatase A-like enzyme